MLCYRLLLVAGIIFSVTGYNIVPGPKVIATKGEIWPKPQLQNTTGSFLQFKCEELKITTVGQSCVLLNSTVNRYKKLLCGTATNSETSNHASNAGILKVLQIDVTNCEDGWPSFDMDESYTLDVKHGTEPQVLLKSKSVWGMMRAMESFSQLLYVMDDKLGLVVLNETHIEDFPRFPHRGLLIDTARHYIPVPQLLQSIDAMAYNKFNIFHWHIVDDQSFPYVSKVFPDMSVKGAYHPRLIYTPEDVQNIIQYARERGIRVIAEFDTPGHTRSWGEAIDKLLTVCYKDNNPDGFLGPIDPTKNSTYTFLKSFFYEVISVFPDQYVHLGGDEVDFSCWESNAAITSFMQKHNITKYQDLEGYYIQKLINIIDDLKGKSIVWEEVFNNGVKLPNGTFVHVWINENTIDKVTKAGLPTLLSACWYLDHLQIGGDWLDFYKCEPSKFLSSEEQLKFVQGGEACMWSEVVDVNNVISRVWPRASSVAERLWSDRNVTDLNDAAKRLEEHTCRMNRRGIAAQPPNGPGFCI